MITVMNFNFIPLWSENNYFQFLKSVEFFFFSQTVPGYDLSRYVFHRYLKIMHVLLLLDGMFYKCRLDLSGWWCSEFFYNLIDYWPNCLFEFYQFLLHMFCTLFSDSCTFKNTVSSWWSNFYHNIMSLSVS